MWLPLVDKMLQKSITTLRKGKHLFKIRILLINPLKALFHLFNLTLDCLLVWVGLKRRELQKIDRRPITMQFKPIWANLYEFSPFFIYCNSKIYSMLQLWSQWRLDYLSWARILRVLWMLYDSVGPIFLQHPFSLYLYISISKNYYKSHIKNT